ncbi:hypothetical protein AOLI_G00036550 [Acnodon oligacanthus]
MSHPASHLVPNGMSGLEVAWRLPCRHVWKKFEQKAGRPVHPLSLPGPQTYKGLKDPRHHSFQETSRPVHPLSLCDFSLVLRTLFYLALVC